MLWSHKKREKSLIEMVSEEIEWFWRVRYSRISRAYITFTCLLSLFISLLTIIILFHPLVIYYGFTLNGYVAPLSYSLTVADRPARYPFLDSLNVISAFTLVFALVTCVLSILGLIGVPKRWRSWITYAPASTASSALLVSLLYSLLRYASLSAIPTLPYTVTVTGVTTGRIYLDPPRTVYTWVYYLPWRPLYFFLTFNLLVAFTAGSIITILLKPKTPVTRARIRRKSEVSSLNQLLNRLRGLLTRSRGGSV
jgi:hypothetical protein